MKTVERLIELDSSGGCGGKVVLRLLPGQSSLSGCPLSCLLQIVLAIYIEKA